MFNEITIIIKSKFFFNVTQLTQVVHSGDLIKRLKRFPSCRNNLIQETKKETRYENPKDMKLHERLLVGS
jgi:hypothetical protein